jgi:[protein-PII] uridylyltransferase
MLSPEPDPNHADPADTLLQTLARGREEAHARHVSGASGIDVTRRLSDTVDRALAGIFQAVLKSYPKAGKKPPRMTVIATGGYGRRRLSPYSDVDLTFIVGEENDPLMDGVVRDMFFLITRVLTEGAGLRVTYAYRTPRDVEDLDTRSQTALLDARWVAGDRSLFYHFREEMMRTIRPAVFVWHKLHERLDALREYGDSVYLVEPNVKMGAGGLRDLHIAEWLAKATMGTGFEDPWGRLRAIGLIEEDEFHAITAGREFLLRVRNGIQWQTDRMADELTTDVQPDLAVQFGYEDRPEKSAVGQMMSDYYRHAAAIQRISRKVAAKCMKHPLRLEVGLVMKGGQITPTDLTLLEKDPAAALRVIHLAQAYQFPLSPEVEEMLGDFAARSDTQLDDPDSHRVFLQILRHPRNIYSALRQMADLGLLPRVIPAYGPLLRLLPSEPGYTHTVGEHSLRVVRELERMRGETERTIYAEVFNSMDRPAVLMLGALLHDVGRVQAEQSHADVGAEMVRTIGANLGLDEESIAMLSFTVRHYDLMPRLTRGRDPEQPETVAELVRAVTNPSWLAPLFLLACADLRALGTETWIHVQMEFLMRLFLRAEPAITRPVAGGDETELVETGIERVRDELSSRDISDDVVRAFCDAMPASYLLHTNLDDIVRHIGMIERLDLGPVIDFHDEHPKPWTVMTVAAADTPGLLADLAGVLYAHDVSVHTARVFTRAGDGGVALDELWVEAQNRPLTAAVQREVTRDLRAVLCGEVSPTEILARRGRELGPPAPIRTVRVNNEASELYSVVEIEMPDEKGLLYRLASTMTAMEWQIHNARVVTGASEVRDTFYITDRGGRKVKAEDVDLALGNGMLSDPAAE